MFWEPDVEMVEIDPFSFKAVVPLEPVVELGDFRSIRLEPEPVEVTEEQVDKFIERMRYDAAPWEPVERPVKFDDLVALDVDGYIEGNQVADDKGVDFIPTKDSPMPFPGFSVYLEGMQADESKEFTLKVPEENPDNTIAGKDCRFNVKVLGIKEKVLPELDDEFAKGVGDGYESLEALRTSILDTLTQRTEWVARRSFEEKSLEEVIKGVSIEVPEVTTNREIDRLLEEQAHAVQGHDMDMDTYLQSVGKSLEELRDEVRPTAQERLTQFLVVRKLAREEGIEVSPEEVEAELQELSSTSNESGEALRDPLTSERARSSIGNSMLTRKVLEHLAQIVEGGLEEVETSEGTSQDATQEPEAPKDEPAEEQAPASGKIEGSGQSEEEGGKPGDNQPV